MTILWVRQWMGVLRQRGEPSALSLSDKGARLEPVWYFRSVVMKGQAELASGRASWRKWPGLGIQADLPPTWGAPKGAPGGREVARQGREAGCPLVGAYLLRCFRQGTACPGTGKGASSTGCPSAAPWDPTQYSPGGPRLLAPASDPAWGCL